MPRIIIILTLCSGWFLSACMPSVYVRKSVDDTAVQAEANKIMPVQWRVPLDASVIEDLQPLEGNRLLLALKHDDDMLSNGELMLVDRVNGQVLWSYNRQQLPGDYSFLLLTEKALLLRVDSQQQSTLLALGIDTGKVFWQQTFNSSGMRYFPVLNTGILVALQQDKTSVTLSGIRMADGQIVWNKQYPHRRNVPVPVVSADSIWHFYDGIEKLDSSNGKRLWQRTNISPGAINPAPQIQADMLYVIDEKHRLYQLSSSSGKTLAKFNIDNRYSITNIYPFGKRIYLRGVLNKKTSGQKNLQGDVERQIRTPVMRNMGFEGADGQTHILLALSRKSGKTLWTYEAIEASVSNLIENKNTLYHATHSRLIALDRNTGKVKFSQMVTNAGRNYPVHIRLLRKNIIYLGEWIVAAYDKNTGKQRYLHGMNPVPDGSATMSGLDDAIARLQQKLGQKSSTSQSIATSLSQDATRFQNQANFYHAQAQSYRNMSRNSAGLTGENYYWKSVQAQNTAQIDSAFSSAYSSIAMTVAIWEMNEKLAEAFRILTTQSDIAHAQLYRKAILGSFVTAENRDYYYRPHSNFNGFVGLSIINLVTGKRLDIMLSPEYRDYGIWNFIDWDKGVIYHHGIGMDIREHRYISQSRGMNTFMIYESYLLAQPVELP